MTGASSGSALESVGQNFTSPRFAASAMASARLVTSSLTKSVFRWLFTVL